MINTKLYTLFFLLLIACCVSSFSILPYCGTRSTASNRQSQKHGQRAATTKSDQEWQAILTPDAYNVLREKGTEAPFSSSLNNLEPSDPGILVCSGCNAPLFQLSEKYDSGTGWPSFTAPVTSTAIAYEVDYAIVVPRTECTCAECGGHLGHVFDDGPQPTGLRYCMNGVAMAYANTTSTSSVSFTAEAPTEAARLPLASVLPSVAFNLGIATLFLTSWLNHTPLEDPGPVEFLLESYPLPIAAFYGYNAAKSLLKAKL